MSNCYVGLDQQFSINFEVTNKEIVQEILKEEKVSRDKIDDSKNNKVYHAPPTTGSTAIKDSENDFYESDSDDAAPIGRGTGRR